jgi:division protein CdvB (Snf7/Vps24/ESCRT-III family)
MVIKLQLLTHSSWIFSYVYNAAHFLSVLWVDQVATKILAQQLIRLRQQIAKLQGSRAQIRGVATHTQVRGSLDEVAKLVVVFL